MWPKAWVFEPIANIDWATGGLWIVTLSLAAATIGSVVTLCVALRVRTFEGRLALSVLGLDRLLVEDQRVAAPAAVGTAFVARIEGGTVWIDIDRKAGDDGRLSHAQSHRWMSGIAADAVMIDFGKLEHVNSSIVAWLLLLVQAARPARFELRHVHRQVQAQLTQLRLNHLLTVKEG